MLSDWLVPGKIEKLLGVAGVAEPDSEQKAGEPSKHQASAQSVAVSQCRKGIEQKEEDLDNDNIYIKSKKDIISDTRKPATLATLPCRSENIWPRTVAPCLRRPATVATVAFRPDSTQQQPILWLQQQIEDACAKNRPVLIELPEGCGLAPALIEERTKQRLERYWTTNPHAACLMSAHLVADSPHRLLLYRIPQDLELVDQNIPSIDLQNSTVANRIINNCSNYSKVI